MVIKVLAIGDLANNIAVLRKYVKKSEIFLVNFPWTGASTITDEKENVLFIDPNNVVKQLNKINELKDSFDVCLVMSPAGARLAYLADLNYIFYLVGNDIRTPPFIKNVKDPLASDAAIHSHNFLERKFYWDVVGGRRNFLVIFDKSLLQAFFACEITSVTGISVEFTFPE